jgi:hypothetical protein
LPQVLPRKFVWTDWIPGGATIHSRKKLMKRTVTRMVPSFKWIVEDLCEQCEAKLPPAEATALKAAPHPPAAE